MFYGLEQSGWKGKRGTAIACNRETRQFYDSVANYAAQYGYLSLYFLQQGYSVLAAHFGFTCGGGYYPLKVAYDEQLQPIRTGTSDNRSGIAGLRGTRSFRIRLFGTPDRSESKMVVPSATAQLLLCLPKKS